MIAGKFIIASLFISAIIFCGNLFAQTKEVDQTFNLNKDGRVNLDTYKGSITIETWDKPQVHVYAKIKPAVNGWSSTDADEQLRNVNVEFNSSDNRLYIKSDYRDSDSWFGSNTRAYVHYKIQMPATAYLFVDDYKSDSDIRGLNSAIDFETYKGSVKILDFTGRIELETYKGDVEIEMKNITDDCRFETYKGKIVLGLPSEAGFELDLDLGKRGDYRSDFDMSFNSIRSHNHRREIYGGKVNGGGPRVEFETYKGDFDLRKL
jgi:hypothetical protein